VNIFEGRGGRRRWGEGEDRDGGGRRWSGGGGDKEDGVEVKKSMEVL